MKGTFSLSNNCVKFMFFFPFPGTITCFTTCCWALQRKNERSSNCCRLKTISTSSRYRVAAPAPQGPQSPSSRAACDKCDKYGNEQHLFI